MATGPGFLIIGGQKCGTTSLYHYLIDHPAVMRATNKELRFFSDHYDRGLDWYHKQFPGAFARFRKRIRYGGGIAGEATPYYLFHPLAAERVKSANPDMKLVIMLRNPVDRAFSHYKHHVKLGEETLEFEQAIDAEAERLAGEQQRVMEEEGYQSHAMRIYSYLARGLYAEQIERWLVHFDRSSMLILNSEAFFADPAPAFAETLEFLGVPPFQHERFQTYNPGKKQSFSPELRARLATYFEPHNQRLYELLGVDYGWD